MRPAPFPPSPVLLFALALPSTLVGCAGSTDTERTPDDAQVPPDALLDAPPARASDAPVWREDSVRAALYVVDASRVGRGLAEAPAAIVERADASPQTLALFETLSTGGAPPPDADCDLAPGATYTFVDVTDVDGTLRRYSDDGGCAALAGAAVLSPPVDGGLVVPDPCDFHRFFGVQTPACTYVDGMRPRLDGVLWRLAAWSAPGEASVPALEGPDMTLAYSYATVTPIAPEFGETAGTGFSSFDGCRSRDVSATIVGRTIEPERADGQADDCPPSETPTYARQQQAFRSVPAGAHAWRIENGGLVLEAADGGALELEPAAAGTDVAEAPAAAPDPALPPVGDAGDARARFANTAWRMTSYGFSDEETSIVAPGGDGRFTLDFGGVDDPTAGGGLDCNGYGASRRAHDRALNLELRIMTDAESCDRSDPAAAAAISIGYAMLDGALAWSIDGDLLRLEDGSGRHADLLRVEPSASLGEWLAGSRWRLFSWTDVGGAERPVARVDDYALRLFDDGAVRVGLDCGELVGEYLIEPDALGVYGMDDTTPVVGCSGPVPEDPDVEPALRRAFADGASLIARVDGTRLILDAGDGRALAYVRVP